MKDLETFLYVDIFKNLREHSDKRVQDALFHYSADLLIRIYSNKDLLLNQEEIKFFECLIKETYEDWKKIFEKDSEV